MSVAIIGIVGGVASAGVSAYSAYSASQGGGSKPQLTNLQKYPAVSRALKGILPDLGQAYGLERAGVSDFIQKYLANQGQSDSNYHQELGNYDQFYNGQMESKLGFLRNKQKEAYDAAYNQAANEAMANTNRSRLGMGGTGSSYAQRLAMGALAPIRVQQGLADVNQQRSDLDYLTSEQLALTGQRTALMDAQAQRSLIPGQSAFQASSDYTNSLNALLGVYNNNSVYGLRQSGPNPAVAATLAGIRGLSSLPTQANGGIPSGGGYGAGANSAGDGVGYGGFRPYTPAPSTLDPGGELALSRGGLVDDYSHGGRVHGPGTGVSDSVPAHLSNGEFVVPAAAVRMPGVLPLLQRIRMMGLAASPGIGVHPRPGGMAGGGIYAGDFGQLGQLDFAYQQAEYARMKDMLDAQEHQREFNLQNQLARNAQDINIAQHRATLGIARQNADTQQSYLDLARNNFAFQKENSPALIHERDLKDQYVLNAAENGDDLSEQASSPAVGQIAKQRAVSVNQQKGLAYSAATEVAGLLNEKSKVDAAVGPDGTGGTLKKTLDSQRHLLGNDPAYKVTEALIEKTRARQVELNKAVSMIDPKHRQTVVNYDPNSGWVPAVPKPKGMGSTIDVDATVTPADPSAPSAPRLGMGDRQVMDANTALPPTPPPAMGMRTPLTMPPTNGLPTNTPAGPRSRFRASDGRIYNIPTVKLRQALQMDPGAVVLQ